jgi:2-keto-4-pentenoate hydratase/2-oxohepta-3-ene-1,7-dioic acid hydratase in catechol pathway
MKLCRFTHNDNTRIGKVVGDSVVDFSGIAGVTASMRALLADYEVLKPKLEAATGPVFPLAEVVLEAPINDPQKFLAIGMNYQKHADEAAAAGIPMPKFQLWFNKQVSCINGPYGTIELPKVSDRLDYEAEMAFVIGKRCHDVSEAEALSVVAGYMVGNDVTIRDWQLRSQTYTMGKSFDTHGPLGPWITTADEIADPYALTIHLQVNGQERQRSSTGDMIYSIAAQIAHLSTAMTLEPGDVILTGTPSGVGIADNFFLKDGDVVRVEVDGLGFIENEVVAEA